MQGWWQDPYLTLEVDNLKRVVRHTRSARAFEDLDTLKRSLRALDEQMAMLPRSGFGLLQDLRSSRGRNDPRFEDVLAQELGRVSSGFRKVAVLVATRVGMLHIQRSFNSMRYFPGRAFLEESEALQWLAE